MERTEKIGLGVAALGHVVLFGALSLSWLWPAKSPPKVTPIDISLVDDVALQSQAPPATEAPAQSQAPEEGPPEEAAPPEAAEAEPAPTPPAKQPEPAPAPKPAPKAPPPPKKEPVAKPDKAKTPPAKTSTAAVKPPSPVKATGTKPNAVRRNPGGFALSEETLKGLSATKSTSKAETPPGATMNAQAAADIGSAIKRQVQPCADRQVNPGPGASRIRVTIRLQLNKDGSLAARPAITAHSGVDDENGRYVDAVDRSAIATFMGCSPLRGLPAELYDVPRGWKTFSLRYNLPG
ncbi:cell envelope biogenesis protein TolA [Sphingomonas alpina]|uniref:Cell envelope biogenesis protein TolA n=1 Tax=Sphingomonas alpina TaxID=653931 RepID=A0A7H0LGH3_9SPHN|nr:cell envelope biogenesis protein TolA [Sphingomonas alpina]QNQ08776.1 cell envelope biogenesis protein TolA [Sphingomonas alpina]